MGVSREAVIEILDGIKNLPYTRADRTYMMIRDATDEVLSTIKRLVELLPEEPPQLEGGAK